MTTKQIPAQTIRLGSVKAAIWANQNEHRGIRHNVTVSRLYKVGDTWKQSDSFGRDDLPVVQAVLQQAYLWIFEQGSVKAEASTQDE